MDIGISAKICDFVENIWTYAKIKVLGQSKEQNGIKINFVQQSVKQIRLKSKEDWAEKRFGKSTACGWIWSQGEESKRIDLTVDRSTRRCAACMQGTGHAVRTIGPNYKDNKETNNDRFVHPAGALPKRLVRAHALIFELPLCPLLPELPSSEALNQTGQGVPARCSLLISIFWKDLHLWTFLCVHRFCCPLELNTFKDFLRFSLKLQSKPWVADHFIDFEVFHRIEGLLLFLKSLGHWHLCRTSGGADPDSSLL